MGANDDVHPNDLAKLREAFEQRNAGLAPHRAFSSPRVDAFRFTVRWIATSTLTTCLSDPDELEKLLKLIGFSEDEFGDLKLLPEVTAIGVAIADEIDARIPPSRRLEP